MKVALYLRVSTDMQDIEMQRKEMESFCRGRGWTIIKTYEDVETGRDPSRLAFNEMLQDARVRKWDALVFWAWDRMTRGGPEKALHIMSRLKDTGVRWVSIKEPFLSWDTDEHTRELLLSLISWLAKQESIRHSERMIAWHAKKKAAGERVGRPKGR